MSEPTPPLKKAAFVLGTARSGTTLLRVMLAGHPKLFSPPEMVLAPFETMAQRAEHLERRYWEKGGLRRALMDVKGIDVATAKAEAAALGDKTIPEVYAHLQELIGDRMLVDKCPHLCAHPDEMRRLEDWFPEVRYIWIVRHPGSVIRSVENMPMAEVMLQGYGEPRDLWWTGNSVIQEFLKGIPPERWAMIRYEDLVTDPEPAMKKACAALDVPYDPLVIDPYQGDRMREGPKGARAIGDPNLSGRGKIDPGLATKWLAGFDHRTVSDETRRLAKQLGYDLDAMELPPIAGVTDALGALFEAATELEKTIRLPMDLDAVEGRRFLVRMLQASLDLFVEQADPDRPAFHHAETPTRKMFADCPDADYLRAPIQTSEGRVYRVWGHVPNETLYLGVLLYGKGGRVGNRFRDEQININDDGHFELFISTEKPKGKGTWLEADGDETAVIVRQYFTDRAKQRSIDVSIELVGAPGRPAPLTPERMQWGLEKAQRMMKSVFKRTAGAYQMVRGMALNKFIEIPGEQLFPTPDNKYRVAWYRFGYNQVMLVRGRLPQARYFGLSLCNAWMESFDYRFHQVNLNHAQIQAEPDGTFEVCLAHRDVGHKNWLDTAGHHAGYLLSRSLLPEGDLPELTTQVMYESELEEYLSSSEKTE